MDTLYSLWLSILVLSAGAGIGRLARAGLRSPDESPMESAVCEVSLGLGALSVVIFCFGACGWFGSIWFRLALLVPAIPGFVLLAAKLASGVRRLWADRPALSDVAGWTILAAIGLCALVPAAAPPSMSDWDSLAYHLSVPKLYLEHGGFYYIRFMSHSNFPMLAEMLYIPGLALGDPVAAKLIHFWMGVLLVLAVIVLARKHFRAQAAIPAAIGLAGMPIVLWEATTAYIDLATALYTVLCVHLLLNYLHKPAYQPLVACGLAAGFAASTKMTGLALVPLVALWLLIDRRAVARRIDWRGALGFAAVALVACSPWYAKSLVYTGSPVYPFFYSIFGGRDWTAALATNYSMLQKQFGMGHNTASFLSLPYDLTFRSDAFYDTPGLYVGPILLLGVPLLFAGGFRSRKLAGLTLFFLAQLAIWFALTQQSRYLIPTFAVLAVVLSATVYENDRLRAARFALAGVFIATAAFGIWTLLPAIRSAAPVALGRETREGYLNRTLDTYSAQQFINASTPRNAGVALFGDTRGFYLDRNYLWADPGHNFQFTREYRSVQDMTAYLVQSGADYAMVNFRFFPTQDKARGASRLVYEAIRSGEWELVYPTIDDRGSAAVYRLR